MSRPQDREKIIRLATSVINLMEDQRSYTQLRKAVREGSEQGFATICQERNIPPEHCEYLYNLWRSSMIEGEPVPFW
jgi:hypothetical protein